MTAEPALTTPDCLLTLAVPAALEEDVLDRSSIKAREIAAARAAAEAGSRSSAAAVKAQAELAKQAEQHKTMGG